MSNNNNIKIFETTGSLAQNVAQLLSNDIKAKLTGAKSVHVALSGGGTPMIMFRELAHYYNDVIPWRSVHFYWGDERCVMPIHPDSNYGMAKMHLFNYVGALAGNIHRIKGEADPELEVVRYAEELSVFVDKKNDLPSFDILFLGMGQDGHTASLFPHQLELYDSPDLCVVASQAKTEQKRITITGKVIHNAQKIYLLVTGTNKAKTLSHIINKREDYLQYPIAQVLQNRPDTNILLDEAAASLL